MTGILRGESLRQKRFLIGTILTAFAISAMLLFIQNQTAQRNLENKIESMDILKESTQMKLIRGEQNAYNDHIGCLLSDLGLLQIYYKSADQYSQEIARTWNSFYQEASKDTDYCQSVLNMTEEQVQEELVLYESYQEQNLPVPLNPELPRASYMVYLNDSHFNWPIILILYLVGLAGIHVFVPVFETGSIKVLYMMPFTKRELNLGLWVAALGLSGVYLLLQYLFLFIGGLIIAGNETILIMINGTATSASILAIENLPYLLFLALSCICVSILIGCCCQNLTDSLLTLLAVLIVIYFIFKNNPEFRNIFTWKGIAVSLMLILTSYFIVWHKFEYLA